MWERSFLCLFIHGYMPNQYLLPAQLMQQDSVQESPEFVLMKSKYPAIKIKSQEPFPLCHQLIPTHLQLFNAKNNQLKEKLLSKPDPAELQQFQDVILGRIQGSSGSTDINQLLMKAYEYDEKEFWNKFLEEKVGRKYYGQGKQICQSIWEVKNVEVLKDIYDVEGIKKHRKIRKQFSSFYKSMLKFLQKFPKLSQQQQTALKEVYEDYRKMEGEETKYSKLIEKNKLDNLKPIDPPKEKENPEIVEQEKIQEQKNEKKLNEESKELESKEKELKKKKKQSTQKKEKKAPEKQVPKYKTLDFFLSKKKKQAIPEEAQESKPDICQPNQAQILLNYFQTPSTLPFSQLKQQFSEKTMKNENPEVLTCYSNIVMAKSRLQYYNFPVTEIKAYFQKPFQTKKQTMYEDSSEEYSEIIAESINEEMMEEEDDDEEQQSNSAIVNDSVCEYQSGHSVSSDEDSESNEQIQPVFNSNKIGKWSFSRSENHQMKQKYEIVFLGEEGCFPLPTKESVEENNEITPQAKKQMFKEVHGSCLSKDVLMKKIASIIDNKLSMNKISSMLKDISEKSGCQRVLKNEIIKEFLEEYPELASEFESQLQQIKKERFSIKNQEMEARREEKQNQKDQKLEKLLMDYEGVKTMSDILEYLKVNDLKMIKSDLSSFIKSREGDKWNELRDQIKVNKQRKKQQKRISKREKKQQKDDPAKGHTPIDQMLKKPGLMEMKPKKKKRRVVRKQEEQEYQVGEEPQRKTRRVRRSGNKVMLSEPMVPQRRNPKRNAKKKDIDEQKQESKMVSQDEQEMSMEEQAEEVEEKEMNGQNEGKIIQASEDSRDKNKMVNTANKSMEMQEQK